jgi:hypothetical protein
MVTRTDYSDLGSPKQNRIIFPDPGNLSPMWQFGSDQAKCLISGNKNSEIGGLLVLNIPFWGQNCGSKDSQKIPLGLNGPFGGQKAAFKTVLAPVLDLFHHHYSWLSWSDPS